MRSDSPLVGITAQTGIIAQCCSISTLDLRNVYCSGYVTVNGGNFIFTQLIVALFSGSGIMSLTFKGGIMRVMLKKVLETVKVLNHSERECVEQALHSIDEYHTVCDLIEKVQDREPHCPHCGHSKLHKHGIRSGIQRYRCKSCRKTFNALYNTPLAHLRKKGQWFAYMQCLADSVTVRKAAETIHISKSTAFRWRHRFTHFMSRDVPKELNGIIEADETYFRFSEKGSHHLTRKPHKRGGFSLKPGISNDLVCVFTACDRSHHDLETVAGFGQVKGEWLVNHFSKFVAKDSVLVTDGMKSYDYLCRKENISHIVVKSIERVRGIFHIQHVNSYHHRLKEWIIGRFHGVATKYLNHYLSWRHELEKYPHPNIEELFMASLGEIHH